MTAELGVDANDKITCTFKLRDETVPSAGLWRVVETSASGECNDQPVEIKTGQTQRYRLSVSNKGQRLEGTGRGGSIRMNRARSDDGRYTGKARIANARWQVRSHDRIVGSNTIKEGKCTFVRNFDMRLIRD